MSQGALNDDDEDIKDQVGGQIELVEKKKTNDGDSPVEEWKNDQNLKISLPFSGDDEGDQE
jgi:hypothetical protein